jgi:hypothetical protein
VGMGGGSGLAAVPPAPSVDGIGGANGRGGQGVGGGTGLGTGSGLAAVPPAPSMDGAGGGNGRGGTGFGAGPGLAAVLPAPSLEGGAGGGGRGGMASLSDGSSGGVPPPPAMGDASNSNTDRGLNGVVELHMRIVGLAFALPGTSFSSTYEVFIAERQLGAHQSQLIKLVYWFLPYQRRLSDYHPDYSKMYKLRVTRDAGCDESLLHMSQSPAGQIFDPSQLAERAQPLNPEEQNTVLPCYRTTADDYRKAMTRGH